MYCIARQCVLPPLSPEQADGLLTEAAFHRLAELFEAVPDRGKWNKAVVKCKVAR